MVGDDGFFRSDEERETDGMGWCRIVSTQSSVICGKESKRRKKKIEMRMEEKPAGKLLGILSYQICTGRIHVVTTADSPYLMSIYAMQNYVAI